MRETIRIDRLRSKFKKVTDRIGYNNFNNSLYGDEIDRAFDKVRYCDELIKGSNTYEDTLIAQIWAGEKVKLEV